METREIVELKMQVQNERRNRIAAQMTALQAQANLIQAEAQDCSNEIARLKALMESFDKPADEGAANVVRDEGADKPA